ncbi:hypothetical protein K466DRAFT_247959 [Polyporus arcularius HHB13444]|uniref:Uncharacterized protein n=1 Tax=Polyporus arcularius HHB13444 TaxID=1314778 RepID=A0A5C3PUW9_9APHY|nr:hypothetical protein K466DRAFT_247959 [Polyporus arcularius HHB13444]
MHHLPVELLEPICYMASTDGQTGAALALVSRTFHEVSRHARFHAVSLHGRPAKIDSFLTTFLLERTRAASASAGLGAALPCNPHPEESGTPSPGPVAPKLKVRHLSITWCDPPRTQTIASQSSLSRDPDADDAQYTTTGDTLPHWRSMQPGLDAHYTRAAAALLSALAADLHTLSLVHAQWTPGTPVLERPFPALRELTLLGGDPPLLDRSDGVVLYPALARLHHVVPFKLAGVHFDDWAVRAPGLTHLRMSCVRDPEDLFLPGLKEVLAGGGLPALRYLCVEEGHVAGDFDLDAEVYLWREVRPNMALEYHFPRRDRDGDLRRRVVQRMREQWQDRVEGGHGCWGRFGDWEESAAKSQCDRDSDGGADDECPW